jgi:hypothetical protein
MVCSLLKVEKKILGENLVVKSCFNESLRNFFKQKEQRKEKRMLLTGRRRKTVN